MDIKKDIKRCGWANKSNPLYIEYHDKDWGVPIHDDKKLFEMLVLEGAQAGLSWLTILKKRENYQEAFDSFDYKIIAEYDEIKINELLKNKGIVRNRLKIRSAVRNAKAVSRIIKEFGTFDEYIWSYVNFNPIQNKFRRSGDLPSNTGLSDKISGDLKKRGMNFVGSTIIYAFMQSIGLVNDHQIDCFRYKELNPA